MTEETPYQRIGSSLIARPEKLPAPEDCQSDAIPTMEKLGLTAKQLTDRPIPGEAAAIDTLKSFLEERGRGYRKGMSSPITGEVMCSRISPISALDV